MSIENVFSIDTNALGDVIHDEVKSYMDDNASELVSDYLNNDDSLGDHIESYLEKNSDWVREVIEDSDLSGYVNDYMKDNAADICADYFSNLDEGEINKWMELYLNRQLEGVRTHIQNCEDEEDRLDERIRDLEKKSGPNFLDLVTSIGIIILAAHYLFTAF